jgi:hypothetical protein
MSTRPSSHARVDEELERKRFFRFTLKCQSAASAHWSAIAAALGCLYSDPEYFLCTFLHNTSASFVGVHLPVIYQASDQVWTTILPRVDDSLGEQACIRPRK